MQELTQRVLSYLGVSVPEAARYLAWFIGPFFAFFKVEILMALLTLVVLDFLTGLVKARIANKITSRKFADALDRICFYLIIYTILHLITVALPIGAISSIPEYIVLTGYLLKEALSNLENIRNIQALRGKNTELLDKLILKIGLDLEKLIQEFDVKKVTENHERP